MIVHQLVPETTLDRSSWKHLMLDQRCPLETTPSGHSSASRGPSLTGSNACTNPHKIQYLLSDIYTCVWVGFFIKRLSLNVYIHEMKYEFEINYQNDKTLKRFERCPSMEVSVVVLQATCIELS